MNNLSLFMCKQCPGFKCQSYKKKKNLISHKCVVWNGKKISSAMFSRWENVTDGMLEIFKFFFSIWFDSSFSEDTSLNHYFLRSSKLKKGRSCLNIHFFVLFLFLGEWYSLKELVSCCKCILLYHLGRKV